METSHQIYQLKSIRVLPFKETQQVKSQKKNLVAPIFDYDATVK